MTTQVIPSAGQGCLYTQQGPGTTPGFAALDDRRQGSGPLQAGVYGTSTLVTAGGVSNVGQADFMVTQRNAGASMTVDVNMPGGGFAWVQGTTIAGQGLYCVPVHSATINEAIAAADPTNPRIDQVILEIQDNALDASGGNQARTRVLTGTPTAGATLPNRNGALALPGNCLLLADVLVANGAASIANSAIRDRRKWARGVAYVQRYTAGNLTTASTTDVVVQSGLLARLECSGVPLRLTLLGVASLSAAAQDGSFTFYQDGAAPDGGTTGSSSHGQGGFVGTFPSGSPLASYVMTPAAGSHLYQPFMRTSGGTLTVNATASFPLAFVVEEIIRQNAANNTVTTG